MRLCREYAIWKNAAAQKKSSYLSMLLKKILALRQNAVIALSRFDSQSCMPAIKKNVCLDC
jgi:hypothetical protein